MLYVCFGYFNVSQWNFGEENDYLYVWWEDFVEYFKVVDFYDYLVMNYIKSNQYGIYIVFFGNGDIDMMLF